MANFSVRVTGRVCELLQRPAESSPSASRRRLQHPDHAPRSRSGWPRRHGGRSGREPHLLRLSGAVCRDQGRAEHADHTGRRGERDIQDHRGRGDQTALERWHFLASYSATKKHIPVAENAFVDPNSVINAVDNTWERIWPHLGAYILPYQVTVSANMENRSGDNAARTVLLSGGTRIPTWSSTPRHRHVEPSGDPLPGSARGESVPLEPGAEADGESQHVQLDHANTVTSWTSLSVRRSSERAPYSRRASSNPARLYAF